MTSLQSPNGNDCGQGVIQDFISDYQEDDDHGYSDNSSEDEEETVDGLLIETPSWFKIITSERQMDGRATIIPPVKVYESPLLSAAAREIKGRAIL